MRVWQAYRFALDPAPHMERACRAHVGAKRFGFMDGRASSPPPSPRREAGGM